MNKPKQKRKPRPSFPQVSPRTQTARVADCLARGGETGPDGFLFRWVDSDRLQIGEVGRVLPGSDVDRTVTFDAPDENGEPVTVTLGATLCEGQTGIPADAEPDTPFSALFDWRALIREQVTAANDAKPESERLDADRLEQAIANAIQTKYDERKPTRRAPETNGRDAARKARLREAFARNRNEKDAALAGFLYSCGAILPLWADWDSFGQVRGFEPVAETLALCPLVRDEEVKRYLFRLLTDRALLVAILARGKEGREGQALLDSVLDFVRDLQNKRARSIRSKVARAHKRKRRGKRK